MGPQAGTENPFFETRQKNASVCWQLCVPKELQSLPRRTAAHTCSASREHSRGNTIRLKNNSCKKTKGVFCIWCLFAKQWTSLVLKEVQLSCQKCYTLSRFGETSDRTRGGGNKRRVETGHLFPPGTSVLLRNIWPDHRAFQKPLLNQKRELNYLLFAHCLDGDQGGLTCHSHPEELILSAQLKTNWDAQASPEPRETFPLLLGVSNGGGHTSQRLHLFLCATNPGFVSSYRPTL